jgi:hypothetical protein
MRNALQHSSDATRLVCKPWLCGARNAAAAEEPKEEEDRRATLQLDAVEMLLGATEVQPLLSAFAKLRES